MMQAESLHREAAFLSNKLHTFADDDIEGVKPVIDSIRQKRNEWKEVRIKLAYFQKSGKLPTPEQEERSKGNVAKEGELRYELQLLNTAIWKLEQKIAIKPDSLKSADWEQKLSKSRIRKEEINQELIRIRYATTQ